MDCDTTGGEPDYALVKYKKLAGGGYMKFVNQSVPAALKNLGYAENEVEEIEKYLEDKSTIEGAPHLTESDYAVFDCASRCGEGIRSISARGHIEMMAAIQPFISGAISKTVNLPADVSINDINSLHMLAWELGVKAVALYRDGSKMSQAIATNMDLLDGIDAETSDILLDDNSSVSSKVNALAKTMARSYRKRLPNRCEGLRQKAKINGHTVYVHTGEYEDGALGEIFLDVNREGTTLSSLFNCFAVAISLGLQYGVPLEEFVEAFTFTKFEPAGFVEGSDYIRMSSSIIDYVFRELAVTYLDRYDLAHNRPLENPEKSKPIEEVASNKSIAPKADALSEARSKGYTGSSCSSCGSMSMIRSGTCEKCNDCGTTTGCS
jgi:ribonucleoside-diphosphate reductase alpha chain